MSKYTERRACPQCGSPKLVYDQSRGEEVCSKCGLVISDVVVDKGPEWRAHTIKEKAVKSRMGPPISYTYYDKGFYTSFRTNKDTQGRRLDPRTRRKMRRLKRYDTRLKLDESGMRNLSRAMNELNKLADTLHLPDSIREKAAIIYRRALEEDLIKGRTIAGFVAASVYAACRQARIPRSLQEVSEASTRDHKDVSRTYRFLLRELDLKMPVDYPMKFVPRFASKVDVSRETDRLTVEILQEAREKKALIGKDPRGIAAAALYLACKANDERCTQKDIAKAAGTTEVTLRNRLRDLENVVEQTDLLERVTNSHDKNSDDW
jgi:transcription initiation factor TFIIB